MTRRFVAGFCIALIAISTVVGAQVLRSTQPDFGPSRPGTVTIAAPTGSEPRSVVAINDQERFEAQAQMLAVTYSSTGMKVSLHSGSYTVTELKTGKQTKKETFEYVNLFFGLNGGLASIAVPVNPVRR